MAAQIQFLEMLRTAAILCAVRNDAAGRRRRPDGQRAGEAGCRQLQDRRHGNRCRAVVEPPRQRAGRVSWGWVSDHLGRERTMFIAFFLQAIFLLGVVTVGRRGDVWFVAMMALVFLTWGEVYSLFPAVSATCSAPAMPRRITAFSTARKAWLRSWRAAGGAAVRKQRLVELRVLRQRRSGVPRGPWRDRSAKNAISAHTR